MLYNKSTATDFPTPDADTLFLASKKGLRTYGDLNQYQAFFLQYLMDANIDLNKPIGLLVSSCDEMILIVAACWKLGIPFVCFDANATTTELKKQIDKLSVSAIIVKKVLGETIQHDNKILLSELALDKALEQEIELGKEAEAFEPDHSLDRIFSYFFTSGTSDTPKIVPLKRRQMVTAAVSSAENFRPAPDHFWLLCLPLNHIGGISIILRSLIYGSGIYRMNNFDKQMVATFLSENKLFQAASLVPTMLKRLIEIPAFQTHHNFKAILLGGGPVDSELLEKAVKKGIPVVSSYGMTETCAQIAANPFHKPSGIYAPMKSVGRLFEPNQIDIRDDSGRSLGPNNSGNIWLQGPQVFDGYLDQKLNKKMFDKQGWFNTGDYGHCNANGHLFIESRRTDLIISGGENVSPYEVEKELERLGAIQEAAVLGISDSEWGQRVVAAIVSANGNQVHEEEIQEKLKERLSSFKIPKQIISVDSLPKNRSGKIVRDALLKLF